MSAVSESIGVLGWIAISPAPASFIKEMTDSAQFYTNRVLKDYKDRDANHASWAKLWLQLLTELQAYVKQNHTTGVSWNATRRSQKFTGKGAASSSSASSVAAAGGAPPPPPPPNFAELFASDESKPRAAAAAPSNDALFVQLNQGADITKHLRPVRDDEKTHKNPNLRAGTLVPASSSSSHSGRSLNSKASNLSTASQKPPVFELVDKKWKVEYQTGRADLLIVDTEIKQTVYVYQCRDCTLTVKGKVNSILIDSCSRVGLLFDDVLSTVEFINSRSVQMQVQGRVPTVAIEKTDGCQVYLSPGSLDTEIVHSKSSNMNVLIPSEKDEGDFVEHPVPEQFKTVINGQTRKLVTTQTEIA